MRKFLKKLLIFFCLFVLLALVMDLVVSNRLSPLLSGKYRGGWGVVYADTTDYDLLINGSSRAYVQYNPEILDSALNLNCYNMGMNGCPIDKQIIKYNAYCRNHGSVPAYLIQNVDFLSLEYDVRRGRTDIFPFFVFDRELMREADIFLKFSWAEKYIPLYRYYGHCPTILAGILDSGDGTDLKKGYFGDSREFDGSEFRKKARYDFLKDTSLLKSFDHFVDQVVKSGTKVVFVYAPIYEGINSKLGRPVVEEMYQLYGDIADRYGVTVLNYNEHDMGKDTAYFYNATHLNKRGSEIFTRMLAKDLDSLGIINLHN